MNEPKTSFPLRLNSTIPPDTEFLKLGFKDFLADTRQVKLGFLDVQLNRLSIHGSMLMSQGAVRIGGFIEASGNLYLDMGYQNLRFDTRLTLYKVPIAGQARLISKSFYFCRPPSWIYEPGLGRGFKFNISDFSLSDRRFLSHTELQFPPLLGGRGIAAALVMNQLTGLHLRLDIDMPNISIPGVPWKLRLPNFSFTFGR